MSSRGQYRGQAEVHFIVGANRKSPSLAVVDSTDCQILDRSRNKGWRSLGRVLEHVQGCVSEPDDDEDSLHSALSDMI
jgi:hypothetical protein